MVFNNEVSTRALGHPRRAIWHDNFGNNNENKLLKIFTPSIELRPLASSSSYSFTGNIISFKNLFSPNSPLFFSVPPSSSSSSSRMIIYEYVEFTLITWSLPKSYSSRVKQVAQLIKTYSEMNLHGIQAMIGQLYRKKKRKGEITLYAGVDIRGT